MEIHTVHKKIHSQPFNCMKIVQTSRLPLMILDLMDPFTNTISLYQRYISGNIWGCTSPMDYLLHQGLRKSFIHSVKMKFMEMLCTIHLDQTLRGYTVTSRQFYHARIQRSRPHQGLCIQIVRCAQYSSG